MKKNTALLSLLFMHYALAAPGWPAGTAAQSPAPPAVPGQTAAVDKDLIELLPRSTVGVLVLDIKRLLEVDAIAKAMEGAEFKKFNDEFVKANGFDPKRDVAYVGMGIPASALAGRLSTPASPVPFKDLAIIVGLGSDKARLQSLVKEKLPEAKEEVYNGVSVFILFDEDKPAAGTPGVLAEVEKIRFQLAFLDDTHIVLGDEAGVRGVIDVHQKKAESLAQVPEMAAFMSRVDRSGIAWSAASYPPEQVQMLARANPLFKGIEGFKGVITAIDDRDSTLVVDLRTIGGTTEQNAAFALNLNGIKAVGALYAAEQPALGELLNGIAITSGEDYTRLNLTVSHETVGKLWRLVESKGAGWIALSAAAERLSREGDHERAAETHKKALELAEAGLGPDHPDVAGILNSLGNLYYHQDRYAEAEPFYIRALAIREKALGPDDLDLAWSLNNLAYNYYYQDQYAEAEPLYKRALEIRERALGPDHADVASLLNGLGNLYYDQDRYAEAEPFYKRALADQGEGPRSR